MPLLYLLPPFLPLLPLLQTEGAVALAEALKDNVGLTIISLQSNELGTDSGVALAAALHINSTLTLLDLGDNRSAARIPHTHIGGCATHAPFQSEM